jgi:hypothetical protein
MKCVCGYEKGYNDDMEIIGDEDFIKLNLITTIKKDWEDRVVDIYCCPKCKTLKLDI